MKSPIVISLLAAACGGAAPDHAAGHPGAHGGHHGHHDFSDAEGFAAIFDDPERDEWQRPDEIVRLLALVPGSIVADLGTGTGYFLPHLSRAVGAGGSVLGLDVEPNMIAHVRERATRGGLANVEARLVEANDPGLAPSSVDRILVVDTWHHLPDRVAYARRLREALRPGGFVLVVDFTRESPHGPPPEMRIDAALVIREASEAGLSARSEQVDLPYQFVVRADRDR